MQWNSKYTVYVKYILYVQMPRPPLTAISSGKLTSLSLDFCMGKMAVLVAKIRVMRIRNDTYIVHLQYPALSGI